MTSKEKKESMFMTWGRIRTLVRRDYAEFEYRRLFKLIEKFNDDLATAKIEEKYFNES